MPKAENLAKMLIDGGETFTFANKAHKTFIHEINPDLWENEAKTYLKVVEPPFFKRNRLCRLAIGSEL